MQRFNSFRKPSSTINQSQKRTQEIIVINDAEPIANKKIKIQASPSMPPLDYNHPEQVFIPLFKQLIDQKNITNILDYWNKSFNLRVWALGKEADMVSPTPTNFRANLSLFNHLIRTEFKPLISLIWNNHSFICDWICGNIHSITIGPYNIYPAITIKQQIDYFKKFNSMGLDDISLKMLQSESFRFNLKYADQESQKELRTLIYRSHKLNNIQEINEILKPHSNIVEKKPSATHNFDPSIYATFDNIYKFNSFMSQMLKPPKPASKKNKNNSNIKDTNLSATTPLVDHSLFPSSTDSNNNDSALPTPEISFNECDQVVDPDVIEQFFNHIFLNDPFEDDSIKLKL